MTTEQIVPERDNATTAFASMLRAAVERRRLPLRAIRQRLADRGYSISVSTLSLWQSGARRPERAISFDILRELEEILHLDDGQLIETLGPSRRVGSSRHEPFAMQIDLPVSSLTIEPEPELLERSGAVGAYVDATGQVTHVLNRTLWQARRDGARDATVFYGGNGPNSAPVDITGTIGCDLVDIACDPQQTLVRATLRLHTPLNQGELALTERRSQELPMDEPENELLIVAPRRQVELMLFAVFDPARRPRHCRVIIEADGESRVQSVPLNGDSATHAEFNFGPGIMTLQWDW